MLELWASGRTHSSVFFIPAAGPLLKENLAELGVWLSGTTLAQRVRGPGIHPQLLCELPSDLDLSLGGKTRCPCVFETIIGLGLVNTCGVRQAALPIWKRRLRPREGSE
jgi:hypothetical protein